VEEIKKVENKLVVQANSLIEASYKLKTSQQKFLRIMASMIKKNDEDLKMYEFKINELLELFQVKDQSKYKEIPKQTRELMGNVLTFKTDKKIIQVPFLNYCEYETGAGILRVQFHPFLKPFYLYLSKENPYTKYELKNILPLKSIYSIRIYELLKQYEKIGKRTIGIEKLRELFQIKKTEYVRYNDFKRKVLQQAQKELPLKTDISFEFEEIKTGRKVTSIGFNIKANTKAIDEVCATSEYKSKVGKEKHSTELITIVKSIFKENITDLQSNKLLDTAKGNINIIKQKYDLASNVPKIDNIVGWMLDAIKKDYIAPKCKIKIDSFNNYEQRLFDPTMESKLLGWDKNEINKDTDEEYQQGMIKSEK